jgi:hypothetical protein
LPPIDSVDFSAVFLGRADATSPRPRRELVIGTEPALSNLSTAPLCASYGAVHLYDALGYEVPKGPNATCTTASGLISDEPSGMFKLMTGDEAQYYDTGPHFPNATTNSNSQDPKYTRACGNGCLYELRSDPFENNDLAATMPAKVAELRGRLEAHEATAFNPHRGNVDPAACAHAIARGGFWGPFVFP